MIWRVTTWYLLRLYQVVWKNNFLVNLKFCNTEKFKRGSYRPYHFWGHFCKASFFSIKKKNKKSFILRVNWKFRFLGFKKKPKTYKCFFVPFLIQIRMDSDRKWKVCLIKVPLFLLKNACGASYKPF